MLKYRQHLVEFIALKSPLSPVFEDNDHAARRFSRHRRSRDQGVRSCLFMVVASRPRSQAKFGIPSPNLKLFPMLLALSCDLSWRLPEPDLEVLERFFSGFKCVFRERVHESLQFLTAHEFQYRSCLAPNTGLCHNSQLSTADKGRRKVLGPFPRLAKFSFRRYADEDWPNATELEILAKVMARSEHDSSE